MMSNSDSKTVAAWKIKNVDNEGWKKYPVYHYSELRRTKFPQLRLTYDDIRVLSLTGSSNPKTKNTRAKIYNLVENTLAAHFDKDEFLVFTSKKALVSVRVVIAVNNLEQLTILRLLEEQFCASETEYKWE